MDLLETREISYFVAVAEELHFGRAAQRLGIAQPPLSRAIKRLERRLGVTLLVRTSRHVALTAAGEVLLRDGLRALDAVTAAAWRAQRAGRPEPRIVLTMKAGSDGGLLADILAGYRAEPEAVPVEVVHSIDERVAMLRDGRADVALLHHPSNDLTGLDTQELLVERQIVILASRHRLADRASVELADLQGEVLPCWPEAAPDTCRPDAPVVRDAGQLMHLVSTGGAVAVLPESAVGQVPRALACVPVLDAHPTALVLAWPQESRSRQVAALVRVATRIAAPRSTAAATASETASGDGERRRPEPPRLVVRPWELANPSAD